MLLDLCLGVFRKKKYIFTKTFITLGEQNVVIILLYTQNKKRAIKRAEGPTFTLAELYFQKILTG